jgi:hypothetical protein
VSSFDTGARRTIFGVCLSFVTATALLPSSVLAADPAVPMQQMQTPGPEAQALAQRVGTWDVVVTLKLSPDAEPVITRGVIAEREMVGQYLQEKMHPAPGSGVPAFSRIAYLTYNQVEGHWQYVSLDTRFPVGIMPATSFDRQQPDHLLLDFAPIGFPGTGETVTGQLVRSNLVIQQQGPEKDVSRQYWVAADGTGRKWLAVQYEYSRHR